MKPLYWSRRRGKLMNLAEARARLEPGGCQDVEGML
jgi:hypothetical protein